MYLGLKIAHSAFTGNYRSDQASTWHPCAFWRWQMDVPALFCISFLEGCVITVQINCNPALGRAAPEGKIRGKSSPCVALAATWSGHPRLRSHQRLPGLYRGCSVLGNRSMGTDFVLCPWQVQCRTCGPRTKVAASPLRRVALARAAEAPDTLSVRHGLLWLKAGLPELPRFPVPRFGAGIRSFSASITSCPPRQGAVTAGSVILAWGWRAEC